MLKWIRAHRCILGLTLLGSAAGSIGGFCLGKVMLVRAAKSSLALYGQELLSSVDTRGDEVDDILGHYPRSLAACSVQDITTLQATTYRSRDLKDMGRTHDGLLYCTAFLGLLPHPRQQTVPSLFLPGGVKIYTNVVTILSSPRDARAVIVEAGDVTVVLNLSSLASWNRPHLSYMVDAVNAHTGKIAQLAGSLLPVAPAFVMSRKVQILHGSIFSSLCSARHAACIVTAERVADVWASARSTQIAYSATGGFAGLSLGLFMALVFRRTRTLSRQLLFAIRRNSPSLFLLYQPIVDVRTGQCLGAEALLRWTDQTGAFIPPDLFISMAEETGFISEITAFVVRRATHDLADLLHTCEDFTLSINIAASDMGNEKLFELLRVNVSLAEIRPSQIALELTERSTADLTLVRAAIQRLRAQGYKVHIDDFGIGFSSLSYIDQLDVNAIKIDRAFSRTIGTDAVIAPILAQMLQMASSLGVDVIVEGVETEFQREYLARRGMPLSAQGWYFSTPLTVEALHAFLEQPHHALT